MAAVDRDTVQQVAALVHRARRVLFITGAGISAESGLPTYRGIGGLYEDVSTDDGMPIEEALSGPMFQRAPELTWKYIAQIESACRGARANRAHAILAELESRIGDTCILTQNVDGFHGDSGSKNIIEIHGNLRHLVCTRCEHGEAVHDYSSLAMPPRCPRCDAIVRPRVVLFGEMLPTDAVAALERELRQGFDVVFSIGTSSLFPYIAQPVLLARMQGVPTVEINPDVTDVSRACDFRLQAGAGAALEAILEALDTLRSTEPHEHGEH